MIKLKSIFAVSVLAMLVVVDVHAEIASKGYVDEQFSNVTIDVDAALSSSSTNPVQNKVINSALAAKQNADTAVTHTANTAVGDSAHPVYVDASGAAVKIDKVAAATNAVQPRQYKTAVGAISPARMWSRPRDLRPPARLWLRMRLAIL